MGLNPFKESNLNDLQKNLRDFFSDHFGDLSERMKLQWALMVKKGRERITVMFIPHSEKKIVNFHISIFAIFSFTTALIITIVITSIIIVNHTSTVKEISKLKMYGTNSKEQIGRFKGEINVLYDIFQKLKPEITHLYSLTPGSNVDSLWAKGGVPNPDGENVTSDEESPPIEVLNIEEMDKELKTTREVLKKVKTFLEARKKIIEHTPSLWPVDGYIISKFGDRVSPYTFRKEFSQGVEIAGFPGAEIRATAPGKIENIWWDPVLGLSVSVSHKYGFETVYSHCQRVSVNVEQMVGKGEIVAYVGRTGKATRPLCLYQIKIGTEFVDPAPYLNKIAQ
ncbi:MAG: M23 family metallopeptidase [Spirochaetes bacterium]|nr:MAG: M23 family metallopeptidase [Spirochaetota bacterium]